MTSQDKVSLSKQQDSCLCQGPCSLIAASQIPSLHEEMMNCAMCWNSVHMGIKFIFEGENAFVMRICMEGMMW